MVIGTSLAIMLEITFLPLARATLSGLSDLVRLNLPRIAVLAEMKSLLAPLSTIVLRRLVALLPTRALYMMRRFLAVGRDEVFSLPLVGLELDCWWGQSGIVVTKLIASTAGSAVNIEETCSCSMLSESVVVLSESVVGWMTSLAAACIILFESDAAAAPQALVAR